MPPVLLAALLPALLASRPVAVDDLPAPPSEQRIVVWKGGSPMEKTPFATQGVGGGDEGCLRFGGEMAAEREADVHGFCLRPDGARLFPFACTPPGAGMLFGGRVLVPRHDAVCAKGDG